MMEGNHPFHSEGSPLWLKSLASARGRAPPTLSLSSSGYDFQYALRSVAVWRFDNMLRTSFVPPPKLGAADSEP